MEPTQEEITYAMAAKLLEEAMPVVVDADKWAEKLERMEYVKFHNLAICYMFEVGKRGETTISGFATKESMELTNETKESFFDKKIKKAMIQRPAQITKLSQEVAEIMKEAGMPQDAIDSLPLHILTESKDILVIKNGYQFGAIALFYPGVMEAVADLIGGSYYVIPSSRHEMMAAPAEVYKPEEIRTMLRKINREEVEEQDRLTDEIYFYDADKNKFMWLVEDLGNLKN